MLVVCTHLTDTRFSHTHTHTYARQEFSIGTRNYVRLYGLVGVIWHYLSSGPPLDEPCELKAERRLSGYARLTVSVRRRTTNAVEYATTFEFRRSREVHSTGYVAHQAEYMRCAEQERDLEQISMRVSCIEGKHLLFQRRVFPAFH